VIQQPEADSKEISLIGHSKRAIIDARIAFNKIWNANLLLYVEQLNGQPIFILEPLLNHITLCVDTLFPTMLHTTREFSTHFDIQWIDGS
jgi:hypothetical protein